MYIFILKPLSCFLSPSDYKNIMSSLGQQVILPCNAPENMEVLAMQWSRCGLEEYVLHYRDDQFDPDGQDPSYMGRVNLTNTHMQNGNLSMILMNMTTADIGTYECIAFQRRSGMGRVVLSIINLNASQSGEFVFMSNDDTLKEFSPPWLLTIHTNAFFFFSTDEGSRDEVSSGAATGRNHLGLIVSLSVIAGIILVVGILYIGYQRCNGSSASTPIWNDINISTCLN